MRFTFNSLNVNTGLRQSHVLDCNGVRVVCATSEVPAVVARAVIFMYDNLVMSMTVDGVEIRRL